MAISERHNKVQGKKRKEYKRMRKVKSLIEPPVDKMVKEPERKKDIWWGLIIRERDIHSGAK